MKISILCPTRGRPKGLENMITSAYKMADKSKDLDFALYMDNDDDDTMREYWEMIIRIGPWWQHLIEVTTGPRIMLSEMWNKCYERAKGEIFMHGADDIVFKTKGWDTKVREAFNKYPDRIAFVYGKDGIQPDSFGTHGFLHKNWVETVGYFVPPYFVSDYNDTWLNDVAYLINRKEHIDILTEHMHFSAGKAEVDQNTKDRLQRHSEGKPHEIYNSKGWERHRDAEKLKEFIKNFYNK